MKGQQENGRCGATVQEEWKRRAVPVGHVSVCNAGERREGEILSVAYG